MARPALVRLCIFPSQWYAHLLGLNPLLLGQELVRHGKLRYLSIIAVVVGSGSSYLHGAAQTEDAVVCLLGSEALEGLLDDIVLLGDQVIGPAKQLALAPCPISPNALLISSQYIFSQYASSRGWPTSVPSACIQQHGSTSWRWAEPICGAMGAWQ